MTQAKIDSKAEARKVLGLFKRDQCKEHWKTELEEEAKNFAFGDETYNLTEDWKDKK